MKRAACFLALLFAAVAPAPAAQPLAARLRQIIERPALAHTFFGIAVYDLDRRVTVFEWNGDKLFIPASTTKLLTEGTSLRLLGPDFRFVTNVYRTGTVDALGTLNGDVILVATGDPNLSGRIRADDTLAFENEDHSYDGNPDTRAVPGDPLLVIRDFARQIAISGIKRIHGRVLVDSSLFPEGGREAGTGAVISPIVVNDNIVDVTVAAGESIGAPVSLTVSPQTPYVHFVNNLRTAAASTRRSVSMHDDEDAGGNHLVTLTGTLPLGSPSVLYAYDVPSPRRFAETALTLALLERGVRVDPQPPDFPILPGQYAGFYTPANMIATHTSAPLSEDVKVTLKVSDNLHADIMPYLWAARVARTRDGMLDAGFGLEQSVLRGAGLDLSGAAQSDGLGSEAWFTPNFMVRYLAYVRAQPYFAPFYRGLPVLGKDGTLFRIAVHSPAAGKVHAKTGTWSRFDLLNHRTVVTAKGLAGYVRSRGGRNLAFCLYLNNLAVPEDRDAAHEAGEVLGALATAIYVGE